MSHWSTREDSSYNVEQAAAFRSILNPSRVSGCPPPVHPPMPGAPIPEFRPVAAEAPHISGFPPPVGPRLAGGPNSFGQPPHLLAPGGPAYIRQEPVYHGLPYINQEYYAHRSPFGERLVCGHGFRGYDGGGPMSPGLMIPPDPDALPSPRPHYVLPDMGGAIRAENPTPADIMKRVRDMDNNFREYQERVEKMRIEDRTRSDKRDNMMNALMNEIKDLKARLAAGPVGSAIPNANTAAPAVLSVPERQAMRSTVQPQQSAAQDSSTDSDTPLVGRKRPSLRKQSASTQAPKRAKGQSVSMANNGLQRRLVSDHRLFPSPSLSRDTSSLLVQQFQGGGGGLLQPQKDLTSLRTRIDLLPSIRPDSDFLNFLKHIDCRYEEDLLCLKKFCKASAMSTEIPIYTETGRSKFYYILKVGGALSSAIGGNPDNQPDQPEPDAKQAKRLGVLELRLHERVPEDVASRYRARYFMPLGEVYRASRSSTKADEVQSTNFFVLMDVTSPKKSIWLVFRYERPFERRDGAGWGTVTFDTTKPLFGTRIFDMVCLLEDVRDWPAPTAENPNLEMVDAERLAEIMRSTPAHHEVLQPALFLPVLTDLRKVTEEGWEKPHEDERMEEEEEEE
ncbi:uncharacterized protein B0T15DRAFT_514620 [Chaetomium strumarium]|uniref:Uncharacterized protein n=1 Tax=Chaetomium strumarium TaxID=1170767 RepID=A0AAJ0LYQ7_9PEZI|nr:hypothetical protein B0T15DRAFT_514620 [Chaetomium strumarium]